MRRPSLDARRLASLAPGLEVEVLEEATSTNAVAADHARAGAAEGRVVVAESQSAGRGRLDRVWQTPPRAALLFSVVLRPTVAAADWPWLPLLTGHSVARALQGLGYDAGVKWPNDVLVARADGESRKLVGILVERIETPDGPAAIVGVGINVSLTEAELPVPTATSLALSGATLRGDALADAVLSGYLAALRELYSDFVRLGADVEASGILQLVSDYCTTLGQEVRVQLPGGSDLVGIATEIDRAGRLVVRSLADGSVTAVAAGDVTHLRYE